MRNFILGLSIGLGCWIYASCGVPPHEHNTNDIKVSNNNSGGACQCKEPTNTLKLVVVDTKCESPVAYNKIDPNEKGIEFKDAKLEDIVSAFQIGPAGSP